MLKRKQQFRWVVSAAAIALAWGTVLLPGVATTPVAQAQTLTVLHSFEGSPDGANPTAGLVMDPNGNLYGTTFFGGEGVCIFGFGGCGTVFMLDANSNESVLYSFTGGRDGASPYASLILDAAGSLYGTATQGGNLKCSRPIGCGTVFKLDATGTGTVLHAFKVGADGESPWGGLLADGAGNFYGTTVNGGGASSNYGTVFKVDAAGKETVLHRFKGKDDGALPFGSLITDSAGTLYGTTSIFGQASSGTVFQLTRSGELTSLHSFTGAQGESPLAGVIRDSTGNLIGTTTYGGASSFGTVFKLDAAGNEIVLHTFTGGSDGAYPYPGVIEDAAGNLYGTTFVGGGTGCGGSGCGTVFMLDKKGNETILHSFTGKNDGGTPYAGVILDAAGNLYGTTFAGGSFGKGLVFRLDTGK